MMPAWTNFREDSVGCVMNAIIEQSLWVILMTLEEMDAMGINYCATSANDMTAFKDRKKELDTDHEVEVRRREAMVVVMP